MLKTIKPFGSQEKKWKKDRDGKNMSQIEITELLLVHCNLVNNIYHQFKIFEYIHSR